MTSRPKRRTGPACWGGMFRSSPVRMASCCLFHRAVFASDRSRLSSLRSSLDIALRLATIGCLLAAVAFLRDGVGVAFFGV